MVKNVDLNTFKLYKDEKTKQRLLEKLQLLVSREMVKTSKETPLDEIIKEIDAIAASMTYLEKKNSICGKRIIKPMLKRMSQRNITETYESIYDIIDNSIMDCPSEKIPHVVNLKKRLTEHSVDDYVDIVDSVVEIIVL